MRQRTEIEGLKSDMTSLKILIDENEAARQDLYREIEVLQTFLRKIAGENSRLRKRLTQVEHVLKAANTARQQMREDIVSSVAKNIEKLLRSQNVDARRVERGVEHTVRAGETLSEIAAAYNVRVAVIVKVNNLKDANILRKGQKLFIPE